MSHRISRENSEVAFSPGSHHPISPSVTREACVFHMDGPALWIMPTDCVNISLSRIQKIVSLDVRMSYDVTPSEARSPADNPDLLLSSRQTNTFHVNINGGWMTSHLCNWQQCFYHFCSDKLYHKCWLVTAKCVITCADCNDYFITLRELQIVGKLHSS